VRREPRLRGPWRQVSGNAVLRDGLISAGRQEALPRVADFSPSEQIE
jgi:hypothetical protein